MLSTHNNDINNRDCGGVDAAIVLAAGRSTRMGISKVLLPWENETVIQQIVKMLNETSINRIVVITGSETAIIYHLIKEDNITIIYNPSFELKDMINSIKIGLSYLYRHSDNDKVRASFIFLGDMPAVTKNVIKAMINQYHNAQGRIIVPRYNRRGGHPILIDRIYWQKIINMVDGKNLREFMNSPDVLVDYLDVDSDGILEDMDTSSDYQKLIDKYAP